MTSRAAERKRTLGKKANCLKGKLQYTVMLVHSFSFLRIPGYKDL